MAVPTQKKGIGFRLLLLSLMPLAAPALALDQATISYPGPSPFYIPVEVARQRGFFRDQNLDIKLIVTKSEVDRAALVSEDIDYTLRASSTVLSAARGLPVRMLFVSTVKPFWALVGAPGDKLGQRPQRQGHGSGRNGRRPRPHQQSYSQAERPRSE